MRDYSRESEKNRAKKKYYQKKNDSKKHERSKLKKMYRDGNKKEDRRNSGYMEY